MTHRLKEGRRSARQEGRAEGTVAPGHVLFRARPTYIALALLALHLLLAAAVFDPTIFTGGDNGVYVALSRAIVQRHAYISLHDPSLAAHTYYPPGYPTILALASLIGIHPWVPIKLVTLAFSAAGSALAYLWLRRRTTPGIALFGGLVTAMSPGLLALSHVELSDVPFWTLATVALWALEAIPPKAWPRVVLAGLAAAAAYLTRTAAVPLIIAALGWLALERQWRNAILFGVLVAPAVLGWYWWTHTHASMVYGNQFWYLDVYRPELGRASAFDLLRRIPENTRLYAGTMIPLLLTGQRDVGALIVLGALVIVLGIAGWVLRLRRIGLGELFFPLYAGMLFVCPPPWAGERYLLPIVPLTLAYGAEAVVWAMRRWRAAAVVPVGMGAFALFLLLSAGSLLARSQDASMCRSAYEAGARYGCLAPEWQDYLSIADWARTGLPTNAIVISRKPGLFFALSDRRGIDVPKTERPEEFFRTARQAGARFLVLDRTDGLTTFYAVPEVLRFPTSFCLVRAGSVDGSGVLGIRLDQPVLQAPAGQPPSIAPCPASYFAPGAEPAEFINPSTR